MIDLVADKWKLVVVCALTDGSARNSELQRQIHGITPKMLTQTLRSLERDGLVRRTTYAVVPPRVEYCLTPLGRSLDGALAPLLKWGTDNLPVVEEARAKADPE